VSGEVQYHSLLNFPIVQAVNKIVSRAVRGIWPGNEHNSTKSK